MREYPRICPSEQPQYGPVSFYPSTFGAEVNMSFYVPLPPVSKLEVNGHYVSALLWGQGVSALLWGEGVAPASSGNEMFTLRRGKKILAHTVVARSDISAGTRASMNPLSARGHSVLSY